MATWIKCSWSFRREVSFTNAIVEFGLNQFIRDCQHMNELMAKMEKDERSDQTDNEICNILFECRLVLEVNMPTLSIWPVFWIDYKWNKYKNS